MDPARDSDMIQLLAKTVAVSRSRSARVLLWWLVAILLYAIVLGTLCSAIAFVSPEVRREWGPLEVAALFPVGEIVFLASQIIGGFLTAAAGLAIGNLGAAIPLFGTGVLLGIVHGGIVLAGVQGARWLVHRVGASGSVDGAGEDEHGQ